MKILQSLSNIQAKLTVPKSQYNDFGKYSYRSCEDILAAVKPFLRDESLVLTLTDKLVLVGARIYVEATATLSNFDGETIKTIAYAREDETRKGMDGSQITGSASSYARKYALNGLFGIDDTSDSDSLPPESNSKPDSKRLACRACKKPIPDLTRKDGTIKKTAQEIAAFTIKECGEQLCWNCYKKHLEDKADEAVTE
jgi:hypothetical protein